MPPTLETPVGRTRGDPADRSPHAPSCARSENPTAREREDPPQGAPDPRNPDVGGSVAVDAWSVRMFGQVFAAGSARGILAAAAGAGPRLVVTANIDHVVRLSQDAGFRVAYAGAAARTLDGMPLVWLAALRGQPATRITGHDLLAAALDDAAIGRRIFLACSRDAVADAMHARLVRSGVDPERIETCVPPIGFERDAVYGAALAARIRGHATTLLVMGVGAPRSETWVADQGAALGAPIVLAVGDALTVAAGLVPRAPRLMQRAGLEWAFRFAHAPRRLFRRYFLRSWRFVGLAARELSGGFPPAP